MPVRSLPALVLAFAILVGGEAWGGATGPATPQPPQRIELVFPVFDMAPWSYFDQACRPRGIAVESLQAIVSKAGLPLALRHERDVDALEAATASGQAGAGHGDVLLRLSSAPERPGMAKIGDLPVFDIDLRVVPAPGAALPGISALAGRRIGMDRDEKRVKEHLEAMGAEAVPFEDYPGMVEAMLAGRLDGVAGLREGLVYALRHQAAGPELLGRNIALRRDPVWLHLGANAPADWSIRLRDAVGHFVGSGRFGVLRDRYLSRAAQAPLDSRKDCVAGGG